MPERQLVVISDLHVHPWSAFAKGTGAGNTRLLQTLDVIRASLEEAEKRDAIWVCPGDFVHTHGYTQNVVLSSLGQVLSEFPAVPKVVIWGNHDARGSGAKIRLEETAVYVLAQAVPHLHVLNNSAWTSEDGIKFYGEGYQPRREFLEVTEKADVGLFHQTVIGTQNAHGYAFKEGVLSVDLEAHYRTVLVGHVHQPAHYFDKVTGKTLLIPGSPEHHNFGDAGEHGYWVLKLAKYRDGWWCEDANLVPSESPKFLTVDRPEKVKADGNFYRVVGASIDPDSLPDNAKAVGSPPTTLPQRDTLRGAFDPETVLQRWVEDNPPEGLRMDDVLAAGRDLVSDKESTSLGTYRLKTFAAEDFMPFQDLSLAVEDGVHLVTGQSRDFQSNGAGKSSLWEIVYWGLFGSTTKGLSADDVIRRGASSCSVTLVLENEGGVCLEITRKRGKGSSTLDILFDGEPYDQGSVTERTKHLQKVLGLTPEIYKILAYFSQENLLLFSRSTDGERKTVLKDLVGTDLYQEAMTAAKAQEKLRSDRVLKGEAKVETLEERLIMADGQVTQAEQDSEQWQAAHAERYAEAKEHLESSRLRAQERRDHLTSRLVTLRQMMEASRQRADVMYQARVPQRAQEILQEMAQSAKVRTQSLREKVIEAQRPVVAEFGSIEKAKAQVQMLPVLEEKVGDFRSKAQKAEADVEKVLENVAAAKQNLHEIQSQIAGAKGRFETHRARFEELQKASDAGTCPTCGQEVQDTDGHMAAHRSEVEEAMRKAEEVVHERRVVEDEARKEVETWEERSQDAIKDAEAKNRRVEQSKQAWDRLHRAKNMLMVLQDRLEALESDKNNIDNYQKQAQARARAELERDKAARLQQLENRVRQAELFVERKVARAQEVAHDAQRTIQSIESEKNPYEQLLRSHKDHAGQLRTSLSKERVVVREAQEERQVYAYWAQAFSRTGIQSLLLDEVAHAFNKNRDRVFPVLTRGVYDVQFSTTSQTSAGELREKTEFVVREHGTPVPYESLSGGQRRRVDLGVMLALALTVSQQHGAPGVLGIMVLDEVFGFLDDDGAEGLFDALQEIQKTVPSLYAVTHDTHLQSMFPSVLHVEQDEHGFSTLRMD